MKSLPTGPLSSVNSSCCLPSKFGDLIGRCLSQYGLGGVMWLSVVLPGQGQSVPNPTDTNYVTELLKKGEALENRQPTTALTYYANARTLASKIDFTKGYFESVRVLTYQLNTVGRHAEARTIALEALRKAQNDTSKRYKGLSHFALAHTALSEGNAREAIPHYQQAARYMELLGNRRNVGAIYQNLGLIYEGQGMYAQALDYYNRSLSIHRRANDPTDTRVLAVDYFSIGNVYVKQRKYAPANVCYLKARQYIDAAADPVFMSSLNNNIGHIYETQARYDSALYYETEALRISRQVKNPRDELHVLMAMAQTYSFMGQPRRAKPRLDEAYRIAQQLHAGLPELRNIYRNYVILNDSLQNYKAVNEWTKKYNFVNDSLTNQETRDLLQDYELKLKQADSGRKLAEKQRQITRLEAQRKRQNLWLLIALLGAGTIGVGLVLGYLYYRQRQRTAANALVAAGRERELAVVQSELQGQQKERLRISKEMHDDLGASLTAIGLLSEVMKTRMGTATTPEIEKISTISADMVTSMNEIIWSLNTQNDNLNGLIAYTRVYASEFIDNTPLVLKTVVTESPQEIIIRGTDRRNVFLTVKESLNNVVKHAQATEVSLTIRPEPDQLLIEVCDNGRGFVRSSQGSLRNGLTNMSNRMAELGGICTISSSSSGTCVKIVYPYAPRPEQ